MVYNKPAREQYRSLGADPDPNDGVVPRESLRTGRSRRRRDRKARQLCSQVAETLSYVLAEQHGDDVLRSLVVLDVEPAPDASRLMVTVCFQPPSGDVGRDRVLECLARASGRLRCEVAASITRRRAPTLVYRAVDSSGAARDQL